MKYSNERISDGDKVISKNNFREVAINNANNLYEKDVKVNDLDIKYSFYKGYTWLYKL